MTRRIFLSWLPAALASAALGWMLYALLRGADGIPRVRELEIQIAAQQKANDALRMENKLAGERVRQLKTDPARMEEIARSRLQMIKEGEVFITEPAK
jgi:cell division protein FtsB